MIFAYLIARLRRSFVAACAPSTTLLRRVVPLPRWRGGGKRERNRRAQTQRARSQIAKISRSVFCRPGAGGAGLLRLFRLLARLPLSAVPARPRMPRRRNRLLRRPPRRRDWPVRRGQSPRAGARPEKFRRAGARRVAERILHRDLAKSPRKARS